MSLQVSKESRLIPASGGVHLLEIAGEPVLELNSVAAIIWSKLASGLQVSEIIEQLVGQFNVAEERATRDVAIFISQMKLRLLIYEDAK